MRIKFCRNSNLASSGSAYSFPQSQLSSGSFIFAYCLSALVAAGAKNIHGGPGGPGELGVPGGPGELGVPVELCGPFGPNGPGAHARPNGLYLQSITVS